MFAGDCPRAPLFQAAGRGGERPKILENLETKRTSEQLERRRESLERGMRDEGKEDEVMASVTTTSAFTVGSFASDVAGWIDSRGSTLSFLLLFFQITNGLAALRYFVVELAQRCPID